ncbi:helix-turn-helix domain-containing protein [Streptomyces sp. NPDC057702]|uniref:helix-turn-helix domain-containing protein n=1 Tax=unclassified Streptomyces TaxID=2593676 RepID=UPI0036C0F0BB
MELNNEDEGRLTPQVLIGRRLRRLRERAGVSQRALASAVHYPHSYISRVERGEQLPSQTLAEALDAYFDTDELFVELLATARELAIPDYGKMVARGEEVASRIQVFNSSLIPGLLQTEDYAQALFRASLPGESAEQIAALVAARMARKMVFEKTEKPFYWAIMDEAALRRPVGGFGCMRSQLHSVLTVAQSPHVAVQVLPFTQGEHPLLGGSLSLLTLANGTTIAYVESYATGHPIESPQRVLELTQRFDKARSQALPEDESIDMVRSYLKEYEHEHDS